MQYGQYGKCLGWVVLMLDCLDSDFVRQAVKSLCKMVTEDGTHCGHICTKVCGVAISQTH